MFWNSKNYHPALRLVKAVTLVELIAFMVIVGIAATSMVGLLSTITDRVKFSEDMVSASFYAEQLMENAIAQGFVNVTNYSQTAVSASDGFAKSVIVRYANVTSGQWVITDDSEDPFKMVNVTISKPNSDAKLTIFQVLSSS